MAACLHGHSLILSLTQQSPPSIGQNNILYLTKALLFPPFPHQQGMCMIQNNRIEMQYNIEVYMANSM